ncbi:MAG: radical SAM protein [Candidatus Falkowbacteria bacterium]
MLRKKYKNAIFVNPPFTEYKAAVAGIAHIRGFLKEKKIASSILNLNDIILSDQECYDEFLSVRKRLSATIAEHRRFTIPEFIEPEIVSGIFLSCDFDKIRKIIKDAGTFDSIFKEHLKVLENYQIVGVSITYKSQILFSLMLANYIKNNIGDSTRVVFGGGIVTSHVNDFLEFLKDDPLVDFFVVGEGETAIRKLIDDNEPSHIPNLIYKKGKKYRFSEKQGFFENIVKLPAPLYEPEDIPTLYMSRQCYWSKCAFCNYDRNYHKKFLNISVDDTIDKLKKINNDIKNKDATFYFADSSLPLNFAAGFSRRIIEDDSLPRNYRAYMRMENSLDENFLRLVRSAGFGRGGLGRISFGLETIVPRLQKIINKGINIDYAMRILDICAKLDIYIDLNIMIGLPTQTKEEFLSELEFMRSVLEKYDNINILCKPLLVQRDSELYYNPELYNIEIVPAKTGDLFKMGYQFTQKYQNAISTREAVILFLDFYCRLPENKQKKFSYFNKLMLYPS